MEFELTYYNVTVQHISCFFMRHLPSIQDFVVEFLDIKSDDNGDISIEDNTKTSSLCVSSGMEPGHRV